MSKTDKTAPFWVKLMRGDLHTEELHDHCDGPCDMPDRDDKRGWGYQNKTRCCRVFSYTGVHVCCCRYCHGDFWSVSPSRRRRIDGKRACRDWQREY